MASSRIRSPRDAAPDSNAWTWALHDENPYTKPRCPQYNEDNVPGEQLAKSHCGSSQWGVSLDIDFGREENNCWVERCRRVLRPIPSSGNTTLLADTSFKPHARHSADFARLHDARCHHKITKIERQTRSPEFRNEIGPECGFDPAPSQTSTQQIDASSLSLRLPSWSSSRSSWRNLRPHTCQAVGNTVDVLTIVLGGATTMMVVNYNQAYETCPTPTTDLNCWLMALDATLHLPETIRCPSTPLACLGFLIYSLVGIAHLPWAPQYWPDCGLVAIVISIGTGAWLGLDAMVDALVITGFLSLLVAKGLERLTGCQRPRREPWLPQSNGDSDGLLHVTSLSSVLSDDQRWMQAEKC